MIPVGITGAMAANWLYWAFNAGYGLLSLALLLALWRAARGPELTDRLVALKLAWLISIGFMTILALQNHAWRMLDLALALALFGGAVPLASAWARRRAEKSDRAEEGESVSNY